MKALSLLFLFSVLVGYVRAQKTSFVTYSTNEGLPQSQVTAIAQTKDGYLWVGTLGGLAKFNGEHFVSYTSESGLVNNRISYLTLIDNQLWIGHDGGVSCRVNTKFKKWNFTGNDKFAIVKSIVNYQGKIIIATYRNGLFEILGGKLRKLTTPTDSFGSVRDLQVHNGKLYIATWDGCWYTTDCKLFSRITSLMDYNSFGIKLRGDKLIVSTGENGLFAYDPISKVAKQIQKENDTIIFRNVAVDSYQTTWVTTVESGIFRLDLAGDGTFIDMSRGLPIDQINCVFEDQSGNIWLGTQGKGLLRFPTEKFVYYDRSTGFPSELILNVNQDKKGTMWYGTFDKGVFSIDKDGAIATFEFPNNTVWTSVFDVDGYKWFGTSNGLVRLSPDGKQQLFTQSDGISPGMITSLFRINSNQMLVTGEDGISLYRNGKFTLLPKSGEQELGKIREIVSLDNQLISATLYGLYHMQNHSFKKVKNFDKAVYATEKDQFNRLWIGTEEGLYYYSKGAISLFPSSLIPISNAINFINASHGKIFVGTNNGVFVISNHEKISNAIVGHYGIDEGIIDLETNLNSDFVDNKGNLWFGTSSGLMKYSISPDNRRKSAPSLHLKSILLNYDVFDYRKYSKNVTADGFPLYLELPFSKNNITFIVDGVSLVHHANLKYQFWLEGLDEKWSPATKNTTISFTGLNPGSYRLRVRAIEQSGELSKEVFFEFEVKPAFYKSWWFMLLILILVSWIILIWVRFKIKRVREVNENEMAAYKTKLISLEQKSLNASMNRHFIFNSLNSIQYFINSQDRLSANRYLTNFAKLIRKNLDSTAEDGNMISLAQELEGIELYLSLESMRFKDRFEYKIISENIDTESIVIPAMLLQPFIENSIIHGILPNEDKKGLITIDLKVENSILTIQIDDNGIGIENSLHTKSDLSGDHRSQGMEITSKRIDLIKKIFNSHFDIKGPFQLTNDQGEILGTRVILKIPFENLES